MEVGYCYVNVTLIVRHGKKITVACLEPRAHKRLKHFHPNTSVSYLPKPPPKKEKKKRDKNCWAKNVECSRTQTQHSWEFVIVNPEYVYNVPSSRLLYENKCLHMKRSSVFILDGVHVLEELPSFHVTRVVFSCAYKVHSVSVVEIPWVLIFFFCHCVYRERVIWVQSIASLNQIIDELDTLFLCFKCKQDKSYNIGEDHADQAKLNVDCVGELNAE